MFLELLGKIDFRTLGMLFMLLLVLEGFKKENIFLPVINFASHFKSLRTLAIFLVFSVFLLSMFVTNDVSLIMIVPLSIELFKKYRKENYIVKVLVLENIAAVRGSLLTPFGSPQNLFIYSQSGISSFDFMKIMIFPWVISIFLLLVFIFFIFRKEKDDLSVLMMSNIADMDNIDKNAEKREVQKWHKDRKLNRIIILCLFALSVFTIVSRNQYWYIFVAVVALVVLFLDISIFKKVDYKLLLTFLCFFVFSSLITSNASVSKFLSKIVEGNEYWISIALSQFISNVPASIVLYPFSTDYRALLYGLDSAGLVTIIGSLASLITMRLYLREYKGNGKKFMINFELISIIFFLIIVLPQYLVIRFFNI